MQNEKGLFRRNGKDLFYFTFDQKYSEKTKRCLTYVKHLSFMIRGKIMSFLNVYIVL